MSKRSKGRLPPFVPLFTATMNAAAWRALSVGAKATFTVLKSKHNAKSQNAVFLSARMGAKELSADKNSVWKWVRELEHYGFIVEVQTALRAGTGQGKAAHYRITDCWYAGRAPTREFESWDGTPFQKPVRKNHTPCLKKSDSCFPKAASSEPHCPKKSDIRNANGCPKEQDITSLTTPCAAQRDLSTKSLN